MTNQIAEIAGATSTLWLGIQMESRSVVEVGMCTSTLPVWTVTFQSRH